jgi:chorismate mutase
MRDLTSLRTEIDQLDKQLWEIIGKRMDVVRAVGEWKRTHGEDILQPQRYQQVVENCVAYGQKHGLSEKFVREVMEIIHNESVRVES